MPAIRPVVLLHGIRTEGKWMRVAAQRLETFFKPVPIPYPHYRHLGAVKIVGEPAILVLALGIGTVVSVRTSAQVVPWVAGVGCLLYAAACAALWGKGRISRGWLIATSAFVLALFIAIEVSEFMARIAAGLVVASVLGVLAHIVGNQRLGRARRYVQTRLGADDVRVPGLPPHVVAHSLGTHVLGNTLQEISWAKCERIVCCASVLTCDFDWTTVFGQARARAVRNETGLRDWVPRLAQTMSVVIPHFGGSGIDGFSGDGVHVIGDAYEDCAFCPPIAPLHNVPSAYPHSGYFISGAQCDDFWLPFLLGLPVGQYARWLQWCHDANESFGRQDDNWLLIQALMLREPWSWTRGPLVAAFERQLNDRSRIDYDYVPSPAEREDLVQLSAMALWRSVVSATAAPQDDHRRRQALNPPTAIAWAVRAALKVYAIG